MSNRHPWIVKARKKNRETALSLAKDFPLPLDLLEYLTSLDYTGDNLKESLFADDAGPGFLSFKDGEQWLKYLITYHDRQIVIYGDYDCDGIGASAILYRGLSEIGFNTRVYINSRFDHGYGINQTSIDEISLEPCDLIICIDHGVVAYEAINYAKTLGIDVLVLDHHQANEELPNALAVVDPQRKDDETVFKALCSGALAYKMLTALYPMMNQDIKVLRKLIGIVAITTLSDVMDVLFENRFFIKYGLEIINNSELACYKVLKSELKNVDEETVRFKIAPMVNAVGRMDKDVTSALRFFISDDPIEVAECYEVLLTYNKKRQLETSSMIAKAAKMIDDNAVCNFLVGNFHEGIVGILASRIKDQTNKVTGVFSENENILKGSLRSIEGFSIKSALDSVANLLEQYGGHDMAGGITLKKENFEAFKHRMDELMLAHGAGSQDVMVDFKYDLDSMGQAQMTQWELLRPYGNGLPYPVIGVLAKNYKAIWVKGKHLKISSRNGNTVIAWNAIEYFNPQWMNLPLKMIVRFDKDNYSQQYQGLVCGKLLEPLSE